jgi:hypothetical protein
MCEVTVNGGCAVFTSFAQVRKLRLAKAGTVDEFRPVTAIREMVEDVKREGARRLQFRHF